MNSSLFSSLGWIHLSCRLIEKCSEVNTSWFRRDTSTWYYVVMSVKVPRTCLICRARQETTVPVLNSSWHSSANT